MAENISHLTAEGYKKLQEEIEFLTTVERPSISRQIAEARDKGDLSENAEYDAAKEAQGLLELKIGQLQVLFRNSRIIDESKIDPSKVQILSKVTVRNLKNNLIVTYTLVAEKEADLKTGRISINSPIGKGLLSKKKGDKVVIQIPSGTIELEIEDVTR